MKSKLKSWWPLLIAVVIIFLLFVFYQFAYTKSEIICGELFKKSKMKGVSYYDFRFEVDGKKYFGTIPRPYIKENLEFDSLKKIDCIKIETSFISPSINRLVDTRILETK